MDIKDNEVESPELIALRIEKIVKALGPERLRYVNPDCGTAEREAALAMLDHKPASRRVTLGGDRGYDTRGFVEATRERKVTPHVAQNDSNRRSAIDERTTRHDGYAVSQRRRKRVEEVIGWMKTVALQRKSRFRGLERVGWMLTLAAAAYNLIRMRNLQAANA